MRRRFYYGWVIVAIGFLAWFFAGGTRDAFSVFIQPWADYFGWSIVAISLAVSIQLVVDAAAAPVGGGLADRFGPRRVLVVLMLAMAIGSLGIATLNSLWQLYLFFGILFGMAASLHPVTTLPVARWCRQRRGMGFSTVSMGAHVGTAVLAPAAVGLYVLGGWRLPWLVFGIIGLVMIVLVATLARSNPALSGPQAPPPSPASSLGLPWARPGAPFPCG